MSDVLITDQPISEFERQLVHRLQRHSAIEVRPYDAAAIAAHARRSAGGLHWPAQTFPRPSRRFGYVLVVVGLILALLIAVAVAGRMPKVPTPPALPPLGRNGVIAYSVMDMLSRPYFHLRFVNADGSDDHEVLQGSTVQFSVDGSAYAYFSGFGSARPGTPQEGPPLALHVAKSDGSSTIDVDQFNQRGAAALSPDGQRLVIVDTRGDVPTSHRLVLVDLSKGSSRDLVPPRTDIAGYGDAAWSPDGRMLAYVVLADRGADVSSYQSEIDVVDVSSGAVRTLTRRPASDVTPISWAPDSSALAYLGRPDPARPPLGTTMEQWFPPVYPFAVMADGTRDTQLSTLQVHSDIGWSPDGSAVAFTNWTGKDVKLAVLGVNRTTPVGVAKIGPSADMFEWAPDANRLLFVHTLNLPDDQFGNQRFQSSIQTIDRDFATDPRQVVGADHNVWSLGWQRLDP